MSQEVAPRRPGIFARRREPTPESIAQGVGVANAKVAAVNEVARYAHMESTFTAAVHKQAEHIMPNATEILSLITWAAGMASVNIITDLPRKLG